MVGKKTGTSLEKILRALAKSKEIINHTHIFKQIEQAEDVAPARSEIMEACITEDDNASQLERVMLYLNSVDINGPEYNAGDEFYKMFKKFFGIIHIEEAPFLLDIAYTRATRHFDNAGKYLTEHKGKDDLLVNLPREYARFKNKIKKKLPSKITKEQKDSLADLKRRLKIYSEYDLDPRNIKTYTRLNTIMRFFQSALTEYSVLQNLVEPHQQRLFAFLHYLRFVDLEFGISSAGMKEVYKRFENVMDFCKEIPSAYIDYPELKETVCKGKWRTFKLKITDKRSVEYSWIEKMQLFEKKNGINLAPAVKTYLTYKEVLENTEKFTFRPTFKPTKT